MPVRVPVLVPVHVPVTQMINGYRLVPEIRQFCMEGADLKGSRVVPTGYLVTCRSNRSKIFSFRSVFWSW
jgi:hypothetical protein